MKSGFIYCELELGSFVFPRVLVRLLAQCRILVEVFAVLNCFVWLVLV